MKIYLDCYPCFLRQALSASRMAGLDSQQQYSVIRETLLLLREIQPGASPPEIGHRVHRLVRRQSLTADPYKAVKDFSTQAALALYPRLKRLVDESDDPLHIALRLSIAGNIIDFGVADHYKDLWINLEEVLSKPFAIDNEAALRAALANSAQILFLADNAGETVFDRLLIEVLKVPVVYAVKESPIINDATVADAVSAGLDQVSRIVSNGADAPGTILSLCSQDFLQIYQAAPLVIAKGQANYETLSEAGSKVFCLLQVKCPVIADDIKAPVGSIVIRQCGSARREISHL